MKVRKSQTDKDLLCQESLNFLSQRISKHFSQNLPGSNLWIPDDSSSWNKPDGAKTTDVVLYGNYLRDFIESEYWPGCDYRIWVLSHKIKECLTKIIEIPSEYISVIPRDQLILGKPVADQSHNYIYGGRISRQKNILDLLLTHAFLQHTQTTDIGLRLFGNYDNAYHEDLGRFNFKHDFQEVVEKYLQSIEWKNKPVIKTGLNSNEWLKGLGSESTFISFSKYHMEDFGVSVAQMHELGIHSLLSSWAGYCDVDPSVASFIDDSQILGHSASLGLRVAHCESLAASIHEKRFLNLPPLNHSMERPRLVDQKILNKIRKSISSKLGPELINIPRDKVAFFADSPKGKRFYKKVRQILSSSKKDISKIIFISTQLGNESLEENQALYLAAKRLLNENINMQMLSLDSISAISKEETKELLSAGKVYCTTEAIAQSPHLKEHLNNLGIKYLFLEEREELPYNMGALTSYV